MKILWLTKITLFLSSNRLFDNKELLPSQILD